MTKTIAFANTLKPVDDVRTFEKLAQTIAKTNKYEVNIIGNSGKKESNHKSIHFHANPINRKSVFRRLTIRVKTLSLLFKISPDLLIVGTHELLGIACVFKILKGCSIIYDVRENYKNNILHLSTLPPIIRQLVASMIRMKETLSRFYVDTFWVAEKCYLLELPFVKNRNVILENKALYTSPATSKRQEFSALFSGSISNYSEVLLAVDTYQKVRGKSSRFSMKIVGQFHDEKLKKQLNAMSENDNHLQLDISSEPVPHQKIMDAIAMADLGIISYQENVVNKDKIPTKLFEYSRSGLPYLIQKETNWASKGKELGGAIPVDFAALDIPFIFDQLNNRDKLFPKPYPIEATWEAQEQDLLDSIEN